MPNHAYWSILLESGKIRSEKDLITTFNKGQKLIRKLDWALDIVSTGDIHHIKEIRLHCPDGRYAVMETTPDQPAFQFKAKSLDMLGWWGSRMEYMVVGRVTDKASGQCDCFIWDYKPLPGNDQLLAYKSTIYNFGGWRNTVTPLTALSLDVQGFRL